jgi:hypothetical protein
VPGDHYRDRFRAEARAAATASSITPATVETYYTAQANGDGHYQSKGSDTPKTEGDVVRRTIYWKAGAFAAINASGFTEVALDDDSTYADLLAAIDDILNANGAPITIWSKREEGPAFLGLLQEYPGAAAAYSLRLLDGDYTGDAIRIRRSGDNAETDIGFDIAGELDRDAIADFCSPGDGFVVTWYDQSGNAVDATQATTSKQPKIYDASTGVQLDNAKPAVTYDTISKLLQAPLAIAHVPLSVFIVQSGPSTQADTPFILATAASFEERTFLQSNAGGGKVQQLVVRSVADGIHAANVSDDFDQGLMTIISKATDDRDIGVNGGAFVNLSTDVTTVDSTFLRLGEQSAEEIKQQEIIIYTTDQSANRAGIESNINDYYSIF